MTGIVWSSKLETGVREIDDQHKQLIDIANRVVEAVQEKLGTLGVDEIIKELREYTVIHFSAEEELMAALHYPDHGPHHIEHERLKNQVKLWQRDLYQKEALTVGEVREFLRGWLIEHILRSDMAFKSWLQENSVCTVTASGKGIKCTRGEG